MKKFKLTLAIIATGFFMIACGGGNNTDTPAMEDQQQIEATQPATHECKGEGNCGGACKEEGAAGCAEHKTAVTPTETKNSTVKSELEKAGQEVVDEAKTAATNKAKSEINKGKEKAKEKINNLLNK